MLIYPVPVSIEYTGKCCDLNALVQIHIHETHRSRMYDHALLLKNFFMDICHREIPLVTGLNQQDVPAVHFFGERQIPEEGYRLEIYSDCINLYSSTPAGGFYGVQTLLQILIQQSDHVIPSLTIEDAPVLKDRALLIDISRNKIPKMKTLYRLVDLMASVKLNQLQLYLEGFAFDYPSYPQVKGEGTPITGEEIAALDEYCRQRHIELVPNHNSFGHMTAWLNHPDFQALSEIDQPEFNWNGRIKPRATLSPADSGSLEFVFSLYRDYLPWFSSRRVNVNCDEAREIGMNRSKQMCEEKGRGRVYLDFLLEIYSAVDKSGFQMMFWGDMIKEYPELIPELPQNAIALEWGYEADAPFDANLRKFAASGLEFYACPGTSTWTTLTGKSDCMIENMNNAAGNALKHGARGIMNTDWGDLGHWQYFLFSFPSFVYGAGCSWNLPKNQSVDNALQFLDKFIFFCTKGSLAQLIYDYGNYYKQEGKDCFNSTRIFHMLHQGNDSGSIFDITQKEYRQVYDYASGLAEKIGLIECDCDDSTVLLRELANVSRMIEHSAELGMLYIESKRIRPSKEAYAQWKSIMEEHKSLWLERNRQGGLAQSMISMENLLEKYRG